MTPRIPILGRLTLMEYVQITATLAFLVVEGVVRGILRRLAWLLPTSVLMMLLKTSDENDDDDEEEDEVERLQARETEKCRLDAYELMTDLGLQWEEHMTITADGYVLTLQRLSSKDNVGEGRMPPSPSREDEKRPAILLLPGCMLSSEVWLCHRQASKNLPVCLLRAGYDVWLGNRRGSHHCPKHVSKSPTTEAFWDFCLDDIALYDVPAMVDAVLEATEEATLTLVGFSQGTAEIFACLCLQRPAWRRKIRLVIALGAMTRPMAMRHAYVRALVHANPTLFYLLFGRKSMLASVTFWIKVLPRHVYARMIRAVLKSLFGWEGERIREPARMFPHMYTTTSVKTIVHWFQMMQRGTFGMYDASGSGSSSRGSRTTGGERMGAKKTDKSMARYPLESIRTPIVLFHGQRDTLCDVRYTRRGLSKAIVCEHVVRGYEHLDFLFADDVDSVVHPLILDALSQAHEHSPSK